MTLSLTLTYYQLIPSLCNQSDVQVVVDKTKDENFTKWRLREFFGRKSTFFHFIHQKILRFPAIILMVKLWSKVDLMLRKVEKINRKFQKITIRL